MNTNKLIRQLLIYRKLMFRWTPTLMGPSDQVGCERRTNSVTTTIIIIIIINNDNVIIDNNNNNIVTVIRVKHGS